MGIIPWGGFFGLIVGRYITKNDSHWAWVVGFILAWVLFIAGIFISYSPAVWHGLSFAGAAAPFFVFRKD